MIIIIQIMIKILNKNLNNENNENNENDENENGMNNMNNNLDDEETQIFPSESVNIY